MQYKYWLRFFVWQTLLPRSCPGQPARCFQELNRRFAAAGLSATAYAVNPGAVRSDIYRSTPKLVMPAFDLLMRCFFLSSDQGCCPSVCTSAWPLEKLSGERNSAVACCHGTSDGRTIETPF